MSIVAYHNIEDLEQKESPLWHQVEGLSQTASGYGRRLATTRMVRLPGNARWRRVYCCIYSNVGTYYVTKGKDWLVIR